LTQPKELDPDALNLPLLKQKGLFGDFIIVAWMLIEMYVDKFVKEDLHLKDTKTTDKLPSSMKFWQKIGLLKARKYIDEEAYRILAEANWHRNRLFHLSGDKPALFMVSSSRREEVMAKFEKAYKVCENLFAQKMTKLDGPTTLGELTGN
jgi:hypothetical protein